MVRFGVGSDCKKGLKAKNLSGAYKVQVSQSQTLAILRSLVCAVPLSVRKSDYSRNSVTLLVGLEVWGPALNYASYEVDGRQSDFGRFGSLQIQIAFDGIVGRLHAVYVGNPKPQMSLALVRDQSKTQQVWENS